MGISYNPNTHHRRSIRLPAFDYSEKGYYFVTICTKDRQYLFGNIVDGRMALNEWGRIVMNEIVKTERIRPNVCMHPWVVMPNHVHFIVNIRRRGAPVARPRDATNIGDGNVCVSPGYPTSPAHARGAPPARPYDDRVRRFGTNVPNTISSIIAQFKSIVTKRIRAITGNPIDIWQRNYFERVIRDDR
jgi:REP element-mobilizing transposase RayT